MLKSLDADETILPVMPERTAILQSATANMTFAMKVDVLNVQ